MISKYEKYIPEIKKVLEKKGIDIDLEKPTTIQDKLNWLNIYDYPLAKTECTDKLLNHKYTEEKLGKDICIPLIKVYNSPIEINWASLPDKFVIRCNHGSGMHIVVRGKSHLDKESAVKQLSKWMDEDYTFRNNYEFNYHEIEHKIMVEELLEDPTQPKLLNTFRFWCFNGKPRFMSVQEGEFGPINHYDADEKFLPELSRKDYPSKYKSNYFIPANFDQMKVYAKKLAEGFRFVCVDFYEVNGEMYLKKMCFTPNANYWLYEYKESNYNVGKMLVLGVEGENEHEGEYNIFKGLKTLQQSTIAAAPASVKVIKKEEPKQQVKKEVIKKIEIKPVVKGKSLYDDEKYKKHILNTGKYFINPLNNVGTSKEIDIKPQERIEKKVYLGGFGEETINLPEGKKIIESPVILGKKVERKDTVNTNAFLDTKIGQDVQLGKVAERPKEVIVGEAEVKNTNDIQIRDVKDKGQIKKVVVKKTYSGNALYSGNDGSVNVGFVGAPAPTVKNIAMPSADFALTYQDKRIEIQAPPKIDIDEVRRIFERRQRIEAQKAEDREKAIVAGAVVKKDECINQDNFEEFCKINANVVDDKTLKLCIIHYNTPKLTECLIGSINKFNPNCLIYVFDNSDKQPFTYRQDNLIYIDNTHGQYIDFNKWLQKYPNRVRSAEATHTYGSAKHCYTVEKCMELIDDNFILLDSDILLKRDICDLADPNYIFVGSLEQQPFHNIKRVLPFITYINVDACKYYGVHYFDDNYMHGLYKTPNGNNYDTGAAFYLHAKDYPFKEINYRDYIEHFKGGSWENIASSRGKRTISSAEWLKQHVKLWSDDGRYANHKVVYTCITGGYDSLKKPSYVNYDYDYVCFTDANIKSDFWQIKPLPKETEGLSNVKKQRYVKINAHKVLPEYDFSIWIDGNVDIRGNLNEYVRANCERYKGAVAIGRHPQRDCVYEEGKECVKLRKDTMTNIVPQLSAYRDEGLPAHYGLPQTCIMFRYHLDPECIKIMEVWWGEIEKRSHRDQLSVSYASWKTGVKINYTDKTIFKSKYFWWGISHGR